MKTNLETLRRSPVFAEEALVVEIQSLMETVMHEKNFTRAQLAEAMGVSRARISQMFSSDAKNFTFRLLARALHAMGEQAEVGCQGHRRQRQRQATVDMLKANDSPWLSPWEHAPVANDRDQRKARLGDMDVALGSSGSDRIIALAPRLAASRGRIAA